MESRVRSVLLFGMLVLVMTVVRGFAQGFTRIPLSTAPETLPPRAPLTDIVTASASGTIVEATTALLGDRGADYLVGSPTPEFSPRADFQAQGVPLWQALDSLLGIYGYDWGVRQGVVLCWPALQPARTRDTPPPPAQDEHTLPLPPDAPALVFQPPVPLPAALMRVADAGFGAIAADRELQSWHLAGRLTHPSPPRLRAALPGALAAVVDGVGPASVLRVGSSRRLHEALALNGARLGPGPGAADEAGPARERLRTAVLAQLTAQQWVLIRNGGVAELAFRELPSDVAALFVRAAEDRLTTAKGENAEVAGIDWSAPARARVEVQVTRGGLLDANGRQALSDFLAVRCLVPNKEGAFLGF
jgi:hypothetical protein